MTSLSSARILYHDAARRGHRASQYNLSVMLHNGEGGIVDNAEAVSWLRRAAAQDDYLAIENLASAYTSPWQGISKDWGEALRFWLLAAPCSKPAVLNNIGVIYAKGFDTMEPDLLTARSWFEKAESRGSANARRNSSALANGLQDGEQLFWDRL